MIGEIHISFRVPVDALSSDLELRLGERRRAAITRDHRGLRSSRRIAGRPFAADGLHRFDLPAVGNIILPSPRWHIGWGRGGGRAAPGYQQRDRGGRETPPTCPL